MWNTVRVLVQQSLLFYKVKLLQSKLVEFIFHLPYVGLVDLVDRFIGRGDLGRGLAKMGLVAAQEMLRCSFEYARKGDLQD